MKLEFQKIAGEEVPVIILECTACDGRISIPERDVKATMPIACSTCNHTRPLSHREFTSINERFAAALLTFLAMKLNRKGRKRALRSAN